MEKNRAVLPRDGAKNQMLDELQSLASALIKAEKRNIKCKADFKEKEKRLKETVQEQQQCIALLD